MTTPTGPDHDRWQDASGAYVLGAMEPAEAEAYARHLEACPACRAEVEDLAPVARALPSAAPPRVVPEEVGARVMAEVRREAALIAAAGPGADEPAPAAGAAGSPVHRPWRGRLRWAAPALAALVLGLGVVIGVGVSGGFGGGPTTVPVTATGAAHGAQGRLVLGDGHATLELAHLPAPPPGHVYEVWLMPHGAGAPRPTQTLFLPRSDGRADVSVPSVPSGVAAVLVTAEPRGGSDAPTSAPVLSASIA